ncbi:MAG: sulfur carrier protein ThiS [Lentisphaerae bacterium]|nr:sulfur carrier protein ThiS [Lentisphaerota bacterium]
MTIQVNGEEVDIDGEVTVTELLTVREVKMPDMVSVELNSEILTRDKFDTTVVKSGDSVEFLYFMGGGQHGIE